jgi:hypothetical protein
MSIAKRLVLIAHCDHCDKEKEYVEAVGIDMPADKIPLPNGWERVKAYDWDYRVTRSVKPQTVSLSAKMYDLLTICPSCIRRYPEES